MNLKEAFRYQNKFNDILHRLNHILSYPEYITKTKYIHYKKSAFPEMEDEEILESQNFKNISINDLIDFTYTIICEKDKLCTAIAEAKKNTDISIDKAIEMNVAIHELMSTLSAMIQTEAHEELRKNSGCGYVYKIDYKEEATYHYDIKAITTINFDRNKVKNLKKKLSKTSYETSEKIEKTLICTEVDYKPIFDVNNSLEEILEEYFA